MEQYEYSYWVKLASRFAVFAAFSMILVKVWAWYLTESATMLASTTDSVFDVAASIINFFVIRYALIPPDDDHRFGHGKAEALAGLAQAAFICGSGLLLVFHSVDRLKNPQPLNQPELAMYATLFSVAMTLALVTVQKMAVKRTQSVAIEADSLHYQSDLLMNIAVLVSLALSAWGYLAVDGWFAIGIALYLIWGARSIAIHAGHTLMDKAMPDEFMQQVQDIACQHDKVYGIHDLRTRRAGPTIFIQFHLEMDDHLPLVEAHAISAEVESALMKAIPEAEVLIHQDPLSAIKTQQKMTKSPAS